MKRIMKWAGTTLFYVIAAAVPATFVMLWTGYFDLVERSYRTKAEATEDDFFKRGWLPDIIPDSARNISAINNLDDNTSRGSFDFDPKDFISFSESLRTLSDRTSRHGDQSRMSELKQAGYESHDFSYKGACWRFLIHPEQGRCEYWASVNRTID